MLTREIGDDSARRSLRYRSKFDGKPLYRDQYQRTLGREEQVEPFSQIRSCPQCGNPATFVYHGPLEVGECRLKSGTHMHRTCTECNYQWAEEPPVKPLSTPAER